MAYQYYDDSRFAANHGRSYRHASHRQDQRPSLPSMNRSHIGQPMYDDEESDYISRPQYSKSDYIDPHFRSSHASRQAHDRRSSRHSNSDYISPPAESRYDDYIQPHSNKTPYPSARPINQDRERHRPNRRVSFSDDPPTQSRPRRPEETRPEKNPREEKSNYQLMKDAGFNNKREFMRAHGLRTWEPDDYDVANEILDKYRDIDAQNARRASPSRRERFTSRSNSFEVQTYPPRYRESPDIEAEYASDSSIASEPPLRSRSPVRNRHVSMSPDTRHYSQSPPSIHHGTDYGRGRASPASSTPYRHSSSPDHRMPGSFPSQSPPSTHRRSYSRSPPSILRRSYSGPRARSRRVRSSSSVAAVSRDGSESASIPGGDGGESDVAVGEEACMSDTVVDSEDEGEGYMHNEYDEIEDSDRSEL